MNEWEAYQYIFTLNTKDFTLVGVRRTGDGWNYSEVRNYGFVGIFTAPAPIANLPIDANTNMEIINQGRRELKDLAGPDILSPVKWEIELEGGAKKKKTFYFGVSLTPLSVLGFEIRDGQYWIKAEVFGTFF